MTDHVTMIIVAIGTQAGGCIDSYFRLVLICNMISYFCLVLLYKTKLGTFLPPYASILLHAALQVFFFLFVLSFHESVSFLLVYSLLSKSVCHVGLRFAIVSCMLAFLCLVPFTYSHVFISHSLWPQSLYQYFSTANQHGYWIYWMLTSGKICATNVKNTRRPTSGLPS